MAVNMSHSQTGTRASAERGRATDAGARTGQLMRAILHRIDDIGPEEGVWVLVLLEPIHRECLYLNASNLRWLFNAHTNTHTCGSKNTGGYGTFKIISNISCSLTM